MWRGGDKYGAFHVLKANFEMTGLCKQLLVPTDCRKKVTIFFFPKKRLHLFQYLGLQRGWEQLGSRSPKPCRPERQMTMLLVRLFQRAAVILMLLC